jgi:hypothetical protein
MASPLVARPSRAGRQSHLSTIAAAATTVTAFAWMLSFGSARTSGLYADHAVRFHPAAAASAATAAKPVRAVTPEGGQLMNLVREATWPSRLRSDRAASSAPNKDSNNG